MTQTHAQMHVRHPPLTICSIGCAPSSCAPAHRLLVALTELLADVGLDITSLECRQHMQQQLRLQATPSGRELNVPAREEQKQQRQVIFQITGVVRSFTPVDRAALDSKLMAAEEQVRAPAPCILPSLSTFQAPRRGSPALNATRHAL